MKYCFFLKTIALSAIVWCSGVAAQTGNLPRTSPSRADCLQAVQTQWLKLLNAQQMQSLLAEKIETENRSVGEQLDQTLRTIADLDKTTSSQASNRQMPVAKQRMHQQNLHQQANSLRKQLESNVDRLEKVVVDEKRAKKKLTEFESLIDQIFEVSAAENNKTRDTKVLFKHQCENDSPDCPLPEAAAKKLRELVMAEPSVKICKKLSGGGTFIDR